MRIKPVKTSATPPAHLVNFDHRLGVIQYRPPGSLKPYDNNPRKHPEKQIVKLMASIRQFGFYLPAVIDDQGTIIIGEARIEAAKRLGIPEVPVLIEDKLTSSQRRALRIADNKLAELGTWDLELLAIEINDIIEIGDVGLETFGFDAGEIDFLLDESTGELIADDPADAVPAIPKHPVSEAGDLWRLGEHRLLCGSSLDAANWTRLMNGEVAQMLFTDAPYNVRIQGNVSGLGKVKHEEFAQASGEMTSAEFTTFLTDAIRCAAAHLKDGSVLDMFMDWRSLGALIEAVRLNDLSLLNMCVWNKTNGGMGSLYRSKHELVVIAKKGDAPHINNVLLGKYGRYRTNVWDYAGANSFGASRDQDLADHPTVKPTALVADARAGIQFEHKSSPASPGNMSTISDATNASRR
ncbi:MULTISPECIES: site-specific DNA-methyltransferase [unclassified Sphingopyxis]|uniref:site-specific DNA-methyltransferase n=1 Tax=unclassified Sphingopyxis TaxID=2614943 RepID=UPI00285F5FB9|nr:MULTISPECIES: site-specific DNA-methyltransferase [unclassified Sphingopyxis]MDR6834133.1 ParB-like chromosome segregation protein Spo0J [Sphingopyxis sp. BE122]MDR7226401.1 ParB-like chromosome segregation protein Spo0J [Sphingopyxis sp. BE259]